jgi:hypothetical protein
MHHATMPIRSSRIRTIVRVLKTEFFWGTYYRAVLMLRVPDADGPGVILCPRRFLENRVIFWFIVWFFLFKIQILNEKR